MKLERLKMAADSGKCTALALLWAAALCVPSASAQTLTVNSTGTSNGFYYSFWKDSGDASFELLEGGRYRSQWNSSTNNWVGGKGWNPGGPRVVNYSGSYNVDNSHNSYLALYGWTRNPLVEYYVIESYGSYNPSSCSTGRQTFGTFESDGATYSIVRCQRIQQPSIEGTQTFDQYFSVRQPQKGFGNISGTITVANHFAAWERAGLNLGTHDYMVLATEGYQSRGSSDITVSEGQASNTGDSNVGNVDDNECGGGSFAETMHCGGVIGFGATDDCFSGSCTGSYAGASTGGNTGGSTGESTGGASGNDTGGDAVSNTGDCQCNWYGSMYPTCDGLSGGWGWENSQSCIGTDTCEDQYGNGGVVCN